MSRFDERQSIPNFRVLGIRVDAVQIPEVVDLMRGWIANRPSPSRFIAVTGMHGISEANRDAQLHAVLNAADLVVPDGKPLVWLGRLRKQNLARRVYGPELMRTFCEVTRSEYRHFFYGGGPGVAARLAATLKQRFGIVVAGTYTPPFRSLTQDEETTVAAQIADACPDVLWVGLSTPKQERWMYDHRGALKVALMVGAGAAFDINSGLVPQAPRWMQENGFEWLFRLLQEPRRLWKRYLITIPPVFFSICLELCGLSGGRSANPSNPDFQQ